MKEKEEKNKRQVVEQTNISHSFKKPIDYLVFQLRQQFLTLSDNELKLLALIYLKGISKTIKVTAVREGIFKSEQTVANAFTKFRKEGILNKEDLPVLQADLITAKEGTMLIKIKLG